MKVMGVAYRWGSLPLVGVACRQWAWLVGSGCNWRAVGVACRQSAWLGGGGRGLQAVGVACR